MASLSNPLPSDTDTRLIHWTPAETVLMDYQNVTVINGIYGSSNLNSLIALSETNFKGQRSWVVYKSRTFNIIKMLSRYFDDPAAFREVQRQTGLVIVGTAVLSYFSRASTAHARIDIAVNPIHAKRVVHHLVCTEGYSVWDGDKLVLGTKWLDSEVHRITRALAAAVTPRFSHRLREGKDRVISNAHFEKKDITVQKIFFEKVDARGVTSVVYLWVAKNGPAELVLQSRTSKGDVLARMSQTDGVER